MWTAVNSSFSSGLLFIICLPTSCFGARGKGRVFKMKLLSGPSFIFFEIRFFLIIQEQIIQFAGSLDILFLPSPLSYFQCFDNFLTLLTSTKLTIKGERKYLISFIC